MIIEMVWMMHKNSRRQDDRKENVRALFDPPVRIRINLPHWAHPCIFLFTLRNILGFSF
jgi:hypothetical protein